jgi:hypothetical protein
VMRNCRPSGVTWIELFRILRYRRVRSRRYHRAPPNQRGLERVRVVITSRDPWFRSRPASRVRWRFA